MHKVDIELMDTLVYRAKCIVNMHGIQSELSQMRVHPHRL